MGLSFFGGPPKWFVFWFPFNDHKRGSQLPRRLLALISQDRKPSLPANRKAHLLEDEGRGKTQAVCVTQSCSRGCRFPKWICHLADRGVALFSLETNPKPRHIQGAKANFVQWIGADRLAQTAKPDALPPKGQKRAFAIRRAQCTHKKTGCKAPAFLSLNRSKGQNPWQRAQRGPRQTE